MNPPPKLSIHEWSAIRSELVWIHDSPIRDLPGFKPERKIKRGLNHVVWLLREGTLLLDHASGKYTVRPESWVFLPPGTIHEKFSQNAHLLSICFQYAWPSGEPFIQINRPCIFPSRSKPRLETRARHLASLVRSHLPSGHHHLQAGQMATPATFAKLRLLFAAWIETWLAACLDEGLGWNRIHSPDERVFSALRLLNEHPLSEPFPKEALLAQSGLGEVHLNRLFLHSIGLTPVKYWQNRRLRAAKDLLATSLMPVKEISWSLGFRTDSHFATWFLKKTQLRPSEFRELPTTEEHV